MGVDDVGHFFEYPLPIVPTRCDYFETFSNSLSKTPWACRVPGFQHARSTRPGTYTRKEGDQHNVRASVYVRCKLTAIPRKGGPFSVLVV